MHPPTLRFRPDTIPIAQRHLTFFAMLLMFSCAAFAEPRKAGVEALITAVGAKADPSIVNEPFSVDFTPDGTMYGVEFTKANRSGANQSDHFPMVRSGLMTRAQR